MKEKRNYKIQNNGIISRNTGEKYYSIDALSTSVVGLTGLWHTTSQQHSRKGQE